MSDTPITDAACGWPWGHHGRIESSDLRWSPDGPFVHSEVARHLERENAALADENRRLHIELDAYHNEEQLRKLRAEVNVTRQNYESFKADNVALRAAIAESEEFARKNGETLAAKVKELLAENATLRASAAESNEYARKHVEAYYQLMEALGRDRGRLDFLESTTGSGWASLLLAEGKWLTRKEIDRRMATEPKP